MKAVRLFSLVPVAGLVIVALIVAGRSLASPGTTERVDVDSAGNQANDESVYWPPDISGDGRYVAFSSVASNLVPGDTNVTLDVFVHDRQTGVTERVSVDSAGNQTNGAEDQSAISGDGRYVAFNSWASNLVPGDTNGATDVFVHDRQTGVTERVSVDSAGNQTNGPSSTFAISGDGRYVAFNSEASNLVPGDTNNFCNRDADPELDNCPDVFVHDRQTGVTERVSVDSAGNQANQYSYWELAISGDGRYVAFMSVASNLVPGDTNGFDDVFVHDRQTGVTERVSVDSAGNQGNEYSTQPAMSGDGRYVAFHSGASNLVPGDTNLCSCVGSGCPKSCADVFVHDRQTGATERVSVDSPGNEANSASSTSDISGDGRYVAFESWASNLVPGDTQLCGNPPSTYNCSDVFVHDRQTGVTQRVSVDSAGNQGNEHSSASAISGDGRYVAFESEASNLVPGDTNGTRDVFVRDREGAGPTPTPTPTPPPPVGGTIDLQRDASAPSSDASGSPAVPYTALAGAAAAAAFAVAAGAWYLRRRRSS
jgi:archaellum component FlaF (FlaF/FlaG flagellin family)